MTALQYALAIIETAALVGVLFLLTKAIKEKKGSQARKDYFRKTLPFLLVYLVLNILRNFYF